MALLNYVILGFDPVHLASGVPAKSCALVANHIDGPLYSNSLVFPVHESSILIVRSGVGCVSIQPSYKVYERLRAILRDSTENASGPVYLGGHMNTGFREDLEAAAGFPRII